MSLNDVYSLFDFVHSKVNAMELLKYSVGLDVSKEKINVCMVTIDREQHVKIKGSRCFANTCNGVEEFKSWLEKRHRHKAVSLVICMEVTGVYHETYACSLEQANYHVSLVVPTLARRYMQSYGQISKNDKIDAEALARMGAERRLAHWKPGSSYYLHLRDLTRLRQSAQEQKTVATNQLHAQTSRYTSNEMVVEKLKAQIALFADQIKELGEEIRKHIDSREDVSENVNRISAIHGIGILTVATIAAETFGFEAFENYRQLISYSGYDVIENQSGKHQGKSRISKCGNSRIRRALFMPSLSAKSDKRSSFAQIYLRTFERHKIPYKSLVAVQRKLLITMFAMWKSGDEYVYDHYQPQAVNNKKGTPAQAGVL